MRRSDDDAPPAYRVETSEVADAEIEAIYEFLATRDAQVAARWYEQMKAAVFVRAAEHARVPGRRYVPPDARNFPGRDMRFVRAGAWRVLYELKDEDGGGLLDTLFVAYVRLAQQSEPTDE